LGNCPQVLTEAGATYKLWARGKLKKGKPTKNAEKKDDEGMVPLLGVEQKTNKFAVMSMNGELIRHDIGHFGTEIAGGKRPE